MSWAKRSIQGVLLDITGVLYNSGEGDGTAIPGSVEAVHRLISSGLPVRFCTNETMTTHHNLVAKLRRLGFKEIELDQVFSPIPAMLRILQRDRLRPFLILHPDAIPEFADFLSEDEPNAVVLADAGNHFTYEKLNGAFRVLINNPNASLFSLGNGRYYRDRDDLVLDVGAFARALEYATDRKAKIVGKPAEEFFLSALNDMGVEPCDAVMVGDDIVNDVGGAQQCGIRGIQVRTGKYRPEDECRSDVTPDGFVENLAQAVDFILEHRK
eukprot:m.84194 g.84194  ORF g.84194 m.84194 type:complete len:269 (+) comp36391_c0_seq1:29-835(+)